jgi:hypothetical protein
MDRQEFEGILSSAPSESERIAWFGALLTREAGLEGKLIIVGGSAIEVYLTSSRYVSQDIDLVGAKGAIVQVLRRWGFRREEGRSGREYWTKDGLGQVDTVGPKDRSGLPPRVERTPYGEVLLAPVEYLIVRRLMRAGREHSTELFRQAEVLAAQYKAGLDWDYIRGEASRENVLTLYEQLRRQVAPRDLREE